MSATLAIFQLSGKQPVAIKRLKTSQRDSVMFCEENVATVEVAGLDPLYIWGTGCV